MMISNRPISFLNFKEINWVDSLPGLPFCNIRASQLNSFLLSKGISLHFFVYISSKKATYSRERGILVKFPVIL